MGFLDSEGLAYFFREKIKPGLGGNGGGGSPIGTIISFMGTSAPAGYLVCDGTEYEITAYPALADFFRQQFGSANHFGGDGTHTFSVPDMRNLFLRGYHGEAGEQLSGEMGERQEGTSIPYISSNLQGSALNFPLGGAESFELETRTTGVNYVGRSGEWNGNNILASYTVRPVNMAVLYCIKAAESVPAENLYSTEEIRIGTWIDGKPLYRKVLVLTAPKELQKEEILYTLPDTVNSKSADAYANYDRGLGFVNLPINYESGINYSFWIYDKKIFASCNRPIYLGGSITVILEYTKTTD